MAYLGYTTKEIKCYPVASAGPTVASPSTSWTWSGWTELVPANTITTNFVITHFISLEFPTAAVDTRHQTVFQLGVGGAGGESPIVSIPVTWLIDSAVGHLAPWIFPLAVPRFVSANSRVTVRVAHSAAAASTFGGCKIMYIELPFT